MGFQADFSSFQSRPGDLVEARRGMWLWAEPVIIDRAIESYAKLLDDPGMVAMARRHCWLWRNILFDQPDSAPSIQVEMRRTADGLGLPASTLDDVDDAILEELLDIVTSRYRSSRHDIKRFSLVLMAAASSLTAARAA